MHPSRAIINLSYLKFNFLNIRKRIKNAKVMAIVKADAYGHGVKGIVSALNSLKEKPDYYGVGFAAEGIELRRFNVPQPVLVFEPFDRFQVSKSFRYKLIPTVFAEEHIEILTREKRRIKKKSPVKVHVKVDTGMNRLGISWKYAVDFVKTLAENKEFTIDGIYTHFASADEPDKEFTSEQINRFKTVLDELKKSRAAYGLVHAANSAAIHNFPESYFDMVRPGLSLYGYAPSETSGSISLKPVMSFVSRITSVKVIEPGDTVSYGRKFRTDRITKIASVPVGYADGFNRGLTNKSFSIMNGKIYPQVGTVTMDRIMFDIDDDNLSLGDEVILLGENKDLKITAWDWAKILNTIPYEITCCITKRIPRVYIE
jgi:alanine racemase